MTDLQHNKNAAAPSRPWRHWLSQQPVATSAPCRIDMGGTLDISTFYVPLQNLQPTTFNLALDLRTRVELHPYLAGRVRIASRGFKSAEFAGGQAPYNHRFGLMFAICDFFGATGVQIRVDSASPPRSALGGSSVAAVALVAAFAEVARRVGEAACSRHQVADIAYIIEAAVAGVACGRQDQLAAAFGGVNEWRWHSPIADDAFDHKRLSPVGGDRALETAILVAYAGNPHVSATINRRWVTQFLAGKSRQEWANIIACTQHFCRAIEDGDFATAATAVNEEVAIRETLTPDVFDAMGRQLKVAALKLGCGARFAGAGGGGCIWAIGAPDAIAELRPEWERLLAAEKEPRLLLWGIDDEGVQVEST
jgi:D-glycero-alpha-D-manno-heptose-7-phosphate kinase